MSSINPINTKHKITASAMVGILMLRLIPDIEIGHQRILGSNMAQKTQL